MTPTKNSEGFFVGVFLFLSVKIGGERMNFSEKLCSLKKVSNGFSHGPAPIPQEGNWSYVKNGIIEEALVETIGCSGMTHSAAMASEILAGKTLLEALNTDLVCDAINVAMREIFLQLAYGRSQSAY
jgi:hypothetical protein